MVFEATYLGELSAAAVRFARPHFVHPVCLSVPHVGDCVVLSLLGAEFLNRLRLPDGLAFWQQAWNVLGSGLVKD